MSYKEVVIVKDPVKERLKAVKAKLKTQGQGPKLTQKEMEEALLDLMEKAGIE